MSAALLGPAQHTKRLVLLAVAASALVVVVVAVGSILNTESCVLPMGHSVGLVSISKPYVFYAPSDQAESPHKGGGGQWPAFYITQPAYTDRITFMEEMFSRHGRRPSRVFGVNNSTMPPEAMARLYDPVEARRVNGWPLTDKEIFCMASHIKVWEAIVDRSVPFALVTEDDAEINGHGLIDRVAEFLQTTTIKWDVCQLNFEEEGQGIDKGYEGLDPSATIVPGVGVLRRLPRSSPRTVAYFVSGRGARELLRLSLPLHITSDGYLAHMACNRKIDVVTVVPESPGDSFPGAAPGPLVLHKLKQLGSRRHEDGWDNRVLDRRIYGYDYLALKMHPRQLDSGHGVGTMAVWGGVLVMVVLVWARRKSRSPHYHGRFSTAPS